MQLSSIRTRLSTSFALLALLCGFASAQQLRERPRYLLHPGDVIELTYRYTPDFNQTVTLQPDGYATINLAGSLRLADLTLDEAHDVILKKAAERLNQPELNVVLKEFQQPYVVVAGEVFKPGKVPLHEGATALQAILLSGGFGENAKDGQVVVFRRIDTDTAEVKVLKLNKLKNRIDLENDMKLEAGDMILVQRDKIAKLARYIKLSNVGFYFNPLNNLAY